MSIRAQAVSPAPPEPVASRVSPFLRQLLEVMRMLQFEVHNYSFKFDQSQSTNMGYEILLWSWQNHTLHHVSVGKYENSLSINNSLIQFHTEDNKVTRGSGAGGKR